VSWNLEHSYLNLPEIFYRRHEPARVPMPKMAVFNENLARELGLGVLMADELSGNVLPAGAVSIAQAYAGFQFGHFAMLGDGRAVLLGEQMTPEGKRFDIQLKGAGRTPFARGADGLAALAPMLREYIISEYMAAVGVPTTRSLAVVLTGREVFRGSDVLDGAVLTRVASSHLRVGTFDFARAYGSDADLRELVDYTVSRHFPDGAGALWLLGSVCRAQGELIARWMLLGFVHGVMNTDNMTISGETIDYGPCAFMDAYEPSTVFSSIDTHGRYAYKNQPAIGAWNLSRLAEALLPLISADRDEAIQLAQGCIDNYWECFNQNFNEGMKGKLGLSKENGELAHELLNLMAIHELDFTNTFYSLINGELPPVLVDWERRWHQELEKQSENPVGIMKKHNPAIIPRNHQVEQVLDAANMGDFEPLKKMLAALNNPYEYSDAYSAPPPKCSGKYVTFCGT